ncbi:MAG: hydrogenase maturation nickel metallochaperone HypA [Acidobacteria bacterium]|jgi:hydrogenase nickel incorporation protein HypA/HybF|nr:hydrogenase maturation nickel metallochaperone HypA [Acidobacteriota bacterium]
MHELSIALSIVDMAMEEAERHGADRVEAVHLRLGLLSGVVARALLASYDLACEQTPLAGSRLLIEDVPIVIYCSICQANRDITSVQSFSCSTCGTPGAHVVQGREIEVVALELPE